MRPKSLNRCIALLLPFVITACAMPAAAPSRPATSDPVPAPTARAKAITIGLSVPVTTIGMLNQSAPTGGFIQLTEIHSDGLITSDVKSRKPIGRLADKAPSV